MRNLKMNKKIQSFLIKEIEIPYFIIVLAFIAIMAVTPFFVIADRAQDNYVKALENSIEAKDNYVKALENSIEAKDNYIKALNDAIKVYEDGFKKLKE